ncbi:metal/formaldehyde-sensitive transcriptional repressor [Dokdonella sp.]|uniref:metal/formaldehyde-sensitive transcriptional repressor n=1 Tax=Dokdonella sp. TaxID=2291710 RepID=UPI0031C2FDEF|nr:metal/formaldehyde-sensitive transcriptional repressor [Xanthomonadales bacterium]
MSHVVLNQSKLLARTRRISGQLAAVEKAIAEGVDCAAVLTQVAAVRGAVQGLLLEVLSEHLREHVANEPRAKLREEETANVISLFRTFMK